MTSSEQHFQKLVGQVRQARISPPDHLRDRFLTQRPVIRRFFLNKKWAIAASLSLVAAISFLLVNQDRPDVLAFPAGVGVEQFDDQNIRIEPVYQVDANFSRMKQGYPMR